jgi:hypothetical protein
MSKLEEKFEMNKDYYSDLCVGKLDLVVLNKENDKMSLAFQVK